MFRPDIYLVILKIALKMSFWCSKKKILAEVFFSMSSQKTAFWSTKIRYLQVSKLYV